MVVAEHRITDGGLDADACCRANHDQSLHAPAAQDLIKLGSEEAAVARLVQDDVVGLGRQLGDDLGVPAVPDEDARRLAIRRDDFRPDIKRDVLEPCR